MRGLGADQLQDKVGTEVTARRAPLRRGALAVPASRALPLSRTEPSKMGNSCVFHDFTPLGVGASPDPDPPPKVGRREPVAGTQRAHSAAAGPRARQVWGREEACS